jgi:pSer/pThr/pTyr-binding forkhead associated (FHA) protein
MLDLDAVDLSPPAPPVTPAASPDADNLLTVERPIGAPTLPPVLPDATGNAAIAYYIQVVAEGTNAVLRTNLPRTDTVQPTAQGIAWLLGRSRNCTIVFPDPAISRCHATLSYQPGRGFQLMDTASSNGTRLNGQRLIAMQPQPVQDGDIITISHIPIQLFIQRSA